MGTGYRIGEWTVRPHRNRIERGSEVVHLAPKAMAVLQCLARAANSVVTRQEIFDAVWPAEVVSDDALTQRIAELRKAFGDAAQQSKIIETIPKTGFRLIPPVIPLAEESLTDLEPHRAAGPGQALKWLAFAVLGLLVVALSLKLFRPGDPENHGVSTDTAEAVIAVLPFVNMSEDPGNEYFSEGIAEELINLLAGVPGLRVISRTSSFSFKNERLKTADIAKELKASLIVEGSVRKAGNSVRIAAQLIEPKTDHHLWAESYDRELSDIFLVQEEIAQSIVTAMQDEIGPYTVSVEQPTENMEAYQIFLNGRNVFHRRGEMLDMAIVLLEMAVKEDPQYAEAWAYLAAAASVTWAYETSITNEDAHRKAEHASRRALELNPGSGLALAVQAMVAWHYYGDLNSTFPLLDRAVAENPQDTTIRFWAGMFCNGWGYFEEALHHFQTASRLDPRVGVHNGMLGLLYLAQGRDELAAQHLRKGTELGPPMHFQAQASQLMMRGETDNAFALLKSANADFGANPDTLAWIYELEEAGRAYIENPALRETLISVVERAPGTGALAETSLSMFFDLKDQFFRYFSLAVRENHFWPIYVLPAIWLPEYKSYVEDPRFFEILSWDGALELWEKRGYPDGCIRVADPAGDHLDCSQRYQ